jgi:hypothetical protein
MNKDFLLMRYQTERDYSERQVLQSIVMLRRILDDIERKVQSGDVRADDGLQGNEWRLYKELSNLEQLNKFIKEIEGMN